MYDNLFLRMYYLSKTQGLAGQVLSVVFLIVMLGAQVVSAQTPLPPCTMSLISELPNDNDGVEQAMDIDKDGDGLIEICDLEGLNEMRYALDGLGYRTSPTDTINRTGCPSGGNCRGFELTRNLSFTDNDSYRAVANTATYTVGSGWAPIGTFDDNFRTRFEGNGHTISNLIINRRSRGFIGLFGVAGVGANIANIGLPNIHIIGDVGVGGLVGENQSATITNSYVMGFVKGSDRVGGLVGLNSGPITNSYATVSVEGSRTVGGLVGSNTAPITNSYATGSVSGSLQVGGLVGSTGASITNSYATGFDDALFGSFVGSPTITNSSTKTDDVTPFLGPLAKSVFMLLPPQIHSEVDNPMHCADGLHYNLCASLL